LRVRRLCALVDPSQPSYKPGYISLLRRSALAKPGAAVEPETARTIEPLALKVSEVVVLIKEIKACPQRTDETGCGCGGLARCALERGYQGLVNHHDCLACLRAQSTR
jgi:hypothetical protein